jgi:hypothetical protein
MGLSKHARAQDLTNKPRPARRGAVPLSMAAAGIGAHAADPIHVPDVEIGGIVNGARPIDRMVFKAWRHAVLIRAIMPIVKFF